MKKKLVLLGLAFLIIIGIIIAGVTVYKHMYYTNPELARKFGNPLPVRVVSAEVKPLTEVVGARGEIQFMSIINVTSKLDRQIKSVNVEVGDMVRKGEVLVRFDNTLLNASLATAEEDIKKTQAELDNAELLLNRMKRLYEKGMVAKIEVEDAEGRIKSARLLHMKAKENLLDINSSLNDSTVTSPVNGVVLERLVNSGETPRADQTMFRIGTTDSIYMVAYIDERRLESINIGQETEVVFDAYHNKVYSGKVAKIGPQVDNKTATFPVFIRLKDANTHLKPGLTSAVRVKNMREGLTVPSISIINPVGDSASLFVVDSRNTAHLRPVKIGAMAEGLTEIVDGLSEGERVVTIGQLYLHDNDYVRIGDEFEDVTKEYARKENIDQGL